MAEGEKIGAAYVEIGADLAKVDAAMNQLPSKVTSKILEIQRKAQAQLARNQLEMKVAVNAGDFRTIDRLKESNDRLKVSLEQANRAALNQAAALRQVNAAARGGASGTPRPTPGVGGGAFGGGAMGLMMLSQTIDDAQYGFKSIVNNLPMLAASIGSAFGMSTDAAMKFGGALGIAGVAINTWIKNWDHAKAAFGGDWATNLQKQFAAIGDSILSAGAKLVNFNSSLRLTGVDLARHARGMEARAAQKKEQEEAIEGAESEVSGVRSTAAEERGREFREALEKFGGGEKLRTEMSGPLEAQAEAGVMERFRIARLKDDRTFDLEKERLEARKKVRDSVNLRIAGALRGDEGAIEGVRAAVPGIGSLQDRMKQEGFEAEGRANIRAFEKQQREKEKAERETQAGFEIEGRKNAQEFDKKRREKRDREAERTAEAMTGSAVGRELLAKPEMEAGDLEERIKLAMTKAGSAADEIAETFPEVAKRLRKKLDEAVEMRALDRGIDEADARKQLVKEAERQAREERIKDAGPKAEVMTDKAYFDKLMTAGLKSTDAAIPKDHLAESKLTNKKLDAIHKALAKLPRQGPAVFGRGKVQL